MAPGAENRSVICDVIAALCSAASRSSAPTLAPTRRAGITKIGSSTSASSVICHDRLSITPSVSTRAITLVTTPDSADVKARWAPITSLFRRLTSAPVWVRVKNAIGIRCTCSNTRRRRSRIRPSPRRDDCEPLEQADAGVDERDAAISTASPTTVPVRVPLDDRVDGPPGQHGSGDAEHRRDRGQDQERDDRAPVRPGELGDAPQRLAAHRSAMLAVLLHRALERHPHADVGHVIAPFSSTKSNLVVQVHLKSRGFGRTVLHMRTDLTIGALSERTGVAPSALRYYEAEGLIHADAIVRAASGATHAT